MVLEMIVLDSLVMLHCSFENPYLFHYKVVFHFQKKGRLRF